MGHIHVDTPINELAFLIQYDDSLSTATAGKMHNVKFKMINVRMRGRAACAFTLFFENTACFGAAESFFYVLLIDTEKQTSVDSSRNDLECIVPTCSPPALS